MSWSSAHSLDRSEGEASGDGSLGLGKDTGIEEYGLEQRDSRQRCPGLAWTQNPSMESGLSFYILCLRQMQVLLRVECEMFPIDSCFKIWSPAGDAVWEVAESVGGGAMMEDVGHCGRQVLRFILASPLLPEGRGGARM